MYMNKYLYGIFVYLTDSLCQFGTLYFVTSKFYVWLYPVQNNDSSISYDHNNDNYTAGNYKDDDGNAIGGDANDNKK